MILDSKKFTSGQRDGFRKTIDETGSIGYLIRSLSPKEISANMLQTYPTLDSDYR